MHGYTKETKNREARVSSKYAMATKQKHVTRSNYCYSNAKESFSFLLVFVKQCALKRCTKKLKISVHGHLSTYQKKEKPAHYLKRISTLGDACGYRTIQNKHYVCSIKHTNTNATRVSRLCGKHEMQVGETCMHAMQINTDKKSVGKSAMNLAVQSVLASEPQNEEICVSCISLLVSMEITHVTWLILLFRSNKLNAPDTCLLLWVRG
jgi:hypothetical protein